MPQVLHITVHMGGGVGKVLSGVAAFAKQNNSKYQHKIIMLESPEKTNFIDICRDNGVEVVIAPNRDFIEEQMKLADIVQLEWWHHPKMAELLYHFPQIPVKLVIWSHVSGCNYPVLPFKFIKIPQRFLFTSVFSHENPHWSEIERSWVKTHTETVNSSGGFENVGNKDKKEHHGFNIGYIGTLSYSKLHPDFLDYCSAIDVPEAKIILVGDSANQRIIEREAQQKGVAERLEFTGYSNNIHKELARFDVFAYPLNPEHFGTTENVLLEAMAAGLPVVALNQCAEKYLIEHMQTGLLANSIQEYAGFIKYLYNNPGERKRIGENARREVLKEFTVIKTVEKLNANYDMVLEMPDQIFNFTSVFGDMPYKWFLSGLGNERKFFQDSLDPRKMDDKVNIFQIEKKIEDCRQILKERSKSSIYQFSKYFPNDVNLKYWCSLIEVCNLNN